jgi:hypothetical protein
MPGSSASAASGRDGSIGCHSRHAAPAGDAGPGLREALSRNTAALVNAIVFLLAAFVIAGVLIVHGNGYGFVILVLAITYAALLASFLADSEKLLRRSLTVLAIFLVVVAVVMALAWQSYRHALAAATYGIWAGAYVRYRVAYSRATRAPILIYTAHSLAAATLLLADYYWQLELSVAVPAILLSLIFYLHSRPQPRPKPRLKKSAANASVGQTTLDKADEGGG